MNRSQRMRRKRQMQRRRRFFSLLLLVLIVAIVRKIDIPSRFTPAVAEASDLTESIRLMSEKSAVNVALKEEKKKVYVEKIEKEKEDRAIRESNKNKKIAYLTFDDGPSSKVTPQILDTLKQYDVKGTFFIIGKNAEQYPELVKRAYEDGHGIANHSYSHDYSYLYSSTENFINDMKKNEEVMKSIISTDYKTDIIRFPGGSHGDKKNPYKEAAVNHGYRYFDWNALNGDAEGKSFPKEHLVNRLKETTQGQKELVVLMHDMGGKQTTADALPEIIEFLKSEGYEFDILR